MNYQLLFNFGLRIIEFTEIELKNNASIEQIKNKFKEEFIKNFINEEE